MEAFSKTPWRVYSRQTVSLDDDEVFIVIVNDEGELVVDVSGLDADIDRIVSCVNACEGLDTEFLQSVKLVDLIEHAEPMIKARALIARENNQ